MHTNTCIGTYLSMNMHISAYMFVICKQNFILFRAMMSLKNLGSFQGHHVRLIGCICTISSVYEKLVCVCSMWLAYDRIQRSVYRFPKWCGRIIRKKIIFFFVCGWGGVHGFAENMKVNQGTLGASKTPLNSMIPLIAVSFICMILLLIHLWGQHTFSVILFDFIIIFWFWLKFTCLSFIKERSIFILCFHLLVGYEVHLQELIFSYFSLFG